MASLRRASNSLTAFHLRLKTYELPQLAEKRLQRLFEEIQGRLCELQTFARREDVEKQGRRQGCEIKVGRLWDEYQDVARAAVQGRQRMRWAGLTVRQLAKG